MARQLLSVLEHAFSCWVVPWERGITTRQVSLCVNCLLACQKTEISNLTNRNIICVFFNLSIFYSFLLFGKIINRLLFRLEFLKIL